jgi:hypothetical protein
MLWHVFKPENPELLVDAANWWITEFGVSLEKFKDSSQPFSLRLNCGLFIHSARDLAETSLRFLLRTLYPRLLSMIYYPANI